MIVTEHVIRDVVVILVAILALAFVWGYWLPSWRLGRLLRRVIPAIRLLRTGEEDIPVLRERVSDILGADRVLGHLWGQYAETLHLQYEAVDGENRLRKIRATVPADAFFSSHVVVDACLNSEFFRHLPGLLTGIGIIGTFLGLILGLAGFEPTGSGEAIKASLGALMQGVMEAFTASAIAIAMAMLITLVEKQQLNRRYKQVEELAQTIDSLYEAGAGEEYLARLVRAGEESATQTRLLKQSLVEDLRQILTDLTERQIEASDSHSQQVAAGVGDALRESLREPLQQIASVVERAAGQQGTAVQGMLEDALTAFMARLEETFGGQMRGLNEMFTQSIASIQEVQQGFQDLAGDLRQVGQTSAAEFSDRLTEALTRSEARQAALLTRMGEFLAEVRRATGESQQANRQHLDETLQLVRGQLEATARALEDHRVTAERADDQRIGRMDGATRAMVESVEDAVERLIRAVGNSTIALERNATQLHEVTTAAIGGMNAGAETMYLAADQFTQGGQAVGSAIAAAGETLAGITQVATIMREAAGNLSTQMANLRGIHDSVRQMERNLRQTVEQARQEVGVSEKLVANMKAAADKLAEAETQAGEYLERVNEVLDTAFKSFGQAVADGLRTSNAAFQQELGTGTELLRAAFTELAAVVGQHQERQ
ncbi:MAG: anti-phage ZorAB system protein ZorA [Accumulibacter sp.]|jgi:hypothetical protein